MNTAAFGAIITAIAFSIIMYLKIKNVRIEEKENLNNKTSKLKQNIDRQTQIIESLNNEITELTKISDDIKQRKNLDNETFEYKNNDNELNRVIEDLNKEILNYKKNNYILTNRIENLDIEILKYKKTIKDLTKKNEWQESFITSMKSNITSAPFLAGIIADIETYGYEKLAQSIDWGYDQKRLKKAQDIREIKKNAKEQIKNAKESQYQLQYLFQLYPALEEVIDCEFSELPQINLEDLNDRDRTRDYLSKEEYLTLSTTERNQLALDRYLESHSKTKWQIGRDYENYVGYLYTKDGYEVDYFGSYMGLEDLGRDLIAKKGNIIHIIQCKYWSSKKVIREKHVNQLYGTLISYCIENNIPKENVTGVLVTNIELSDMAKKMAKYLGIKFKEHLEKGEYPCIKCNTNYDVYGLKTKIYHLPFDQKYDATKIKNEDEFYAFTVKEAEEKGFRRAYKWLGG